MRTIWAILWLRKVSVNAQIANETNLCIEESWPATTRNGGGSGWCGSAFSKFPTQLSYCVSSGFTDFCSMFDNFTPFVSVLHQIFQAMRGQYWKISWRLSMCLWSTFSGLLGSASPKTVRHRAVSSGGSDLSCGQHDQPNKAVIASRWCRCWEEKVELKLWRLGCIFAMWCQESSTDRLCESGSVSLYAVDKLSMFPNHKGGW